MRHEIATASAKDLDYVRDLGADTGIGFRAGRFEDAAGGILVSAVAQPDQKLAKRYGVRAAFFLVDINAAQPARIAELIEAGEWKTSVGAVLRFDDVRIVHEMFEGSRPSPRGKIGLSPTAR